MDSPAKIVKVSLNPFEEVAVVSTIGTRMSPQLCIEPYWQFPYDPQAGTLNVTSSLPATLTISGIQGTFDTPFTQSLDAGTYLLTIEGTEQIQIIPIIIEDSKTTTVQIYFAEVIIT